MNSSKRLVVIGVMAFSLLTKTALAQAPAAAATKPDDTPSVKISGVLFSDYTYTNSPKAADTDGNSYHPSAFGVSRAYLNFTGNVSHLVAFRITPDVTRETGTGSSLNGSMVFRIKYAFAQLNGSERNTWVRLGIQQTPWVDFQETIYRYRFQGTVFSERDGYLSSSDAGASYHTDLPGGYGDVHAGYYNGENYNHFEVNNQKSLQMRGTLRPLPKSATLKGLRVTGFYDKDSYVKNADRNRFIGSATFEHKRLNAGAEYLSTKDRTSVMRASVEGKGYSVWATPKSATGWEALLRHDHLTPNTTFDTQVRSRNIAGVAYWFPHQGSVSASLMLDYDSTTFSNFKPDQPKQQRVALHGLVSF